MENKINIAELLKDCPQGMELDCTIWDNIVFEEIDGNSIVIYRKSVDSKVYLTQYGELNSIDGKCVIFPKDKTTWEGFHRPFKDGDIVISSLGSIHILKNSTTSYCYIDRLGLLDKTETTCVRVMRFATEEEKQKLFDAIKEKGYKWNAETKTLEKLIEPKFKVGDRVKHISAYASGIVVKVTDKGYHIDYPKGEGICYISFTLEKDYELAPNKFDINILVPFEDKVLVRNAKNQKWVPAFWGYKVADGFVTTFGWCKYCIPYEGNENLFKTNNDCDDFYKTWKS